MTLPGSRSRPYRRKNNILHRVRYDIVHLLQKVPWLWKIFSCARTLQKKYTIRTRASKAVQDGTREGYYGADFDVDRILWIDPQQVVYNSQREFSVNDFKGQLIDGDWDLPQTKFDDLDICMAIRAVCQEGKQWGETLFYQRAVARLKQGYSTWGCTNQPALDQRCMFLERLYRSIRDTGYKTQSELALLYPKGQAEKSGEEEIGINIGRSGNLLFSDGAHRLAIAKVLELKRIPVKAVVRHPQWAETRKQILQYTRSTDPQTIPPFPHPDLGDIPCNHEYEQIFQAILDDLPEPSSNLLDIGAQFGYFCHRFEEQGKNCYALEEREVERKFLHVLQHAMNRKFSIIEIPLDSLDFPSNIVIDAILVLNMFSQVESHPDRLADLRNCFGRLNFRRLYVLSTTCEGIERWPGHQGDTNGNPLAMLAGNLAIGYVKPLTRLANGKTLYMLRRS